MSPCTCTIKKLIVESILLDWSFQDTYDTLITILLFTFGGIEELGYIRTGGLSGYSFPRYNPRMFGDIELDWLRKYDLFTLFEEVQLLLNMYSRIPILAAIQNINERLQVGGNYIAGNFL